MKKSLFLIGVLGDSEGALRLLENKEQVSEKRAKEDGADDDEDDGGGGRSRRRSKRSGVGV